MKVSYRPYVPSPKRAPSPLDPRQMLFAHNKQIEILRRIFLGKRGNFEEVIKKS